MSDKTKLILLRESRELSRYRVAQDTGIPYNALMRLESGSASRLPIKWIRTLREYYGDALTLEHFIS